MTKEFKTILLTIAVLGLTIFLVGTIALRSTSPTAIPQYRTEWGLVVQNHNGTVLVLTPKDGEMWEYEGDDPTGGYVLLTFQTLGTDDVKDDGIIRAIG